MSGMLFRTHIEHPWLAIQLPFPKVAKLMDCLGRHQTHPSPQRTPVIFQAGASKSGIEFAGKHAEALYCGSLLPPSTASYVKAVRAEAEKNGRDPQSIKFFAGISPIVGRTLEKAQAKYEACRANIDIIGGLAKFSGFTNLDMSVYPLDEPFEFNGGPQDNTIQGIVNNFKAGYLDNKPWTPRRLGEEMAFGGLVNIPYISQVITNLCL
jgi:alkanesulfonate monooxygenase SsuD/methylene tetrahydromethanopterin reductase-like flavin-dependent oxidoreductase (luciferase family)